MTKPYSLCLQEWLDIRDLGNRDEYCLDWFSDLLEYNNYGDKYQEYKNENYTLIFSSYINEIVAMNRYRRMKK